MRSNMYYMTRFIYFSPRRAIIYFELTICIIKHIQCLTLKPLNTIIQSLPAKQLIFPTTKYPSKCVLIPKRKYHVGRKLFFASSSKS